MVGFPVVGTEDVVDAHIHTAAVIRPSRAVAGRHIAVGEQVSHAVVGVGNRALVEVTAEDDGHPSDVPGHVGCHRIDLRSPFPRGCCEFVDEVGRLLPGLVPAKFSLHKIFESGLVGRVEQVRLQVVVDHQHVFPVHIKHVSHAQIAIRLVVNALHTLDGEAAVEP